MNKLRCYTCGKFLSEAEHVYIKKTQVNLLTKFGEIIELQKKEFVLCNNCHLGDK
jgi:hypothetical protein